MENIEGSPQPSGHNVADGFEHLNGPGATVLTGEGLLVSAVNKVAPSSPAKTKQARTAGVDVHAEEPLLHDAGGASQEHLSVPFLCMVPETAAVAGLDVASTTNAPSPSPLADATNKPKVVPAKQGAQGAARRLHSPARIKSQLQEQLEEMTAQLAAKEEEQKQALEVAVASCSDRDRHYAAKVDAVRAWQLAQADYDALRREYKGFLRQQQVVFKALLRVKTSTLDKAEYAKVADWCTARIGQVKLELTEGHGRVVAHLHQGISNMLYTLVDVVVSAINMTTDIIQDNETYREVGKSRAVKAMLQSTLTGPLEVAVVGWRDLASAQTLRLVKEMGQEVIVTLLQQAADMAVAYEAEKAKVQGALKAEGSAQEEARILREQLVDAQRQAADAKTAAAKAEDEKLAAAAAKEAAESALAGVTAQLSETREHLGAERAKLVAAEDRFGVERKQLHADMDAIKSNASVVVTEMSGKSEENDRLKAVNEKLQQKVNEAALELSRAEAAHAHEVQRIKDAHRNEMDSARSDAAAKDAELQRLRPLEPELEAVRGQLITAKAQGTKAGDALVAKSAEVDAAVTRYESLLQSTTLERHQLATSLAQEEKKSQGLQHQLEGANASLAASTKDVTALREQLSQLEASVNMEQAQAVRRMLAAGLDDECEDEYGEEQHDAAGTGSASLAVAGSTGTRSAGAVITARSPASHGSALRSSTGSAFPAHTTFPAPAIMGPASGCSSVGTGGVTSRSARSSHDATRTGAGAALMAAPATSAHTLALPPTAPRTSVKLNKPLFVKPEPGPTGSG